MQYYYGEKNILRALDEAEFWKHQEIEHTVVIQTIVPELEDEYALSLKEFGASLSDTQANVVKYIQSAIRSGGELSQELKLEMLEFTRYCIYQSEEFACFLEYIVRNSNAVKNDSTAQTVIYHIIRESNYFIGIEQLIVDD